MARNMAKRFATMTIVYWNPIYGGSGMSYESPVEFKGFYIGNACLGNNPLENMIGASDRRNENLVLFYMLEPKVGGCVCWDKSLSTLLADGLSELPPSEIPGTAKIKKVAEYVMPRTRTATLADKAFIAMLE
jgi:hypothetical protein